MCNDDIYLLQIILMGLGKDERAVGSITYVNYPSMQPCIYLETTQFSLDIWTEKQAVEYIWEYVRTIMSVGRQTFAWAAMFTYKGRHQWSLSHMKFSIIRDCVYPYQM
jgi:hypothetical protein